MAVAADKVLIYEQLSDLHELSAVSSNKVFRKHFAEASDDLVRAYVEVVHNLLHNETLVRVLTRGEKQFIRRRRGVLGSLAKPKLPLKSKRRRLATLGLSFLKRVLPIVDRYLVPVPT